VGSLLPRVKIGGYPAIRPARQANPRQAKHAEDAGLNMPDATVRVNSNDTADPNRRNHGPEDL
jgi:hypothetical protein